MLKSQGCWFKSNRGSTFDLRVCVVGGFVVEFRDTLR